MKRLKLLLCFLTVVLLFIGCQSNDKSSDEGVRPMRDPMGNDNIINDPALWGELNTHDPSIIKADGKYYVFSTDTSIGNAHKSGVQVRASEDLITWEYLGPLFENYAEECPEPIAYAGLDAENNQGFWAPDIMEVNGKYRLYFSASTFGSSKSCIALAESDKIMGPYTYKGIVVSSNVNAVKNPNCIDPGVIETPDGKMYMTYGSFFGGIFIVELDSKTGFVADNAEHIKIAGGHHASIEGPVIRYIEESGYYYLFVSYGSLSSDYNIRVARSKDITGPYLDANGNDMNSLAPGNEEKIGTKLMGGYTFLADPPALSTKGIMAPGHNGLLVEGNDYFIVHHARSYKLPEYWFKMHVRRFAINKDGWPVILPNLFSGEKFIKTDLPNGTYGVVMHGTNNNSTSNSSIRCDFKDGTITGGYEGNYEVYDDYRISITLDGISYDGVIADQYEAERKADVTAFSAMSETGLTIWGYTQL